MSLEHKTDPSVKELAHLGNEFAAHLDGKKNIAFHLTNELARFIKRYSKLPDFVYVVAENLGGPKFSVDTAYSRIGAINYLNFASNLEYVYINAAGSRIPGPVGSHVTLASKKKEHKIYIKDTCQLATTIERLSSKAYAEKKVVSIFYHAHLLFYRAIPIARWLKSGHITKFDKLDYHEADYNQHEKKEKKDKHEEKGKKDKH